VNEQDVDSAAAADAAATSIALPAASALWMTHVSTQAIRPAHAGIQRQRLERIADAYARVGCLLVRESRPASGASRGNER
jgi:hypothetical protein